MLACQYNQSRPVTLTNLLTTKLVSESRVTWTTSVPITVFLGLSVLNLGLMYVTDMLRQTDVQCFADMKFGCGCRAGPIANLRGWGWGVALALFGWTCSEPLRRGLVARHCSASGRMSRCAVHLHSLDWEHNLGLKSFNQYPSPRPLTAQQRENL